MKLQKTIQATVEPSSDRRGFLATPRNLQPNVILQVKSTASVFPGTTETRMIAQVPCITCSNLETFLTRQRPTLQFQLLE